jgi:hypothetical protein
LSIPHFFGGTAAQCPDAQSEAKMHDFSFAQRVGHFAAPPPQSTSVSLPSLVASSQSTVPPQPSGASAQVRPSAAQVDFVQPQTLALQVSLGLPPRQSEGVLHSTQLPLPSQKPPPFSLQVVVCGALSGPTQS